MAVCDWNVVVEDFELMDNCFFENDAQCWHTLDTSEVATVTNSRTKLAACTVCIKHVFTLEILLRDIILRFVVIGITYGFTLQWPPPFEAEENVHAIRFVLRQVHVRDSACTPQGLVHYGLPLA